jgi:hypothetical protein
MVAHFKLVIAKMKRDQFRQSSERRRKPLGQIGITAREAGGERDRA